jgi:Zn-dependent protease with chaperone function
MHKRNLLIIVPAIIGILLYIGLLFLKQLEFKRYLNPNYRYIVAILTAGVFLFELIILEWFLAEKLEQKMNISDNLK